MDHFNRLVNDLARYKECQAGSIHVFIRINYDNGRPRPDWNWGIYTTNIFSIRIPGGWSGIGYSQPSIKNVPSYNRHMSGQEDNTYIANEWGAMRETQHENRYGEPKKRSARL